MSEHEYTCGEFEEMDLRELHDEMFMVAVGKGYRDQNQYLCNTLCGPLDFYTMVETVGMIWEQEQVHARVMIPHKQYGKPPVSLDENTIDFIEARHQDIIMDGVLDGQIFEEKEYTCKAGFFIPEETNQESDSEEDNA